MFKKQKEELIDIEILDADEAIEKVDDWQDDFLFQRKEEDPIIEIDLIEEEKDINIIEPKLTETEVTQILNAAEIKTESENYQLNVFGEEIIEKVEEIDVDNTRSVAFIVGLFSILAIFIFLLPIIVKYLK